MKGKRFGRLVIIKNNGKRWHDAAWLCRCDCGNMHTALAGNLRSGATQSCGCLRREWTRRKFTKHGGSANGKLTAQYSIYRHAKERAARLGIPFSLELVDISIPETCPVLGILLVRRSKTSPGSPTLDRLIPRLGYTKENTRVISHRANTIKNSASLEEIRKVMEWMEKEVREDIP